MNTQIGVNLKKSKALFLFKVRTEYLLLSSLVFLSVLIHIYLSIAIPGYILDQNDFLVWMQEIQTYGLGGAYVHSIIPINYPPLFICILDIYGKFLRLIHLTPQVGGFIIKFPMMAMDILSTIVLFYVTKRFNSERRMMTIALFALSPTIIFESAIWGQVDILHGVLMLIAILVLFDSPVIVGSLLSLALLSKFQAIVILPVIGAVVLRQIFIQHNVKSTVRMIVGFMIPLITTVILFAIKGGLTDMIQKGYTSAVGAVPIVNMNAMNIWYYLLGFSPDTSDTLMIVQGITLRTFGFILLTIAVIMTMIYIFKSKKLDTLTVLKASAFLSFSFFMLPTEIHDRYNFPTILFVMSTLLFTKSWTKYIVFLSVTTFFNLVTVVQRFHITVNPISDMWIVYLNVIIYSMMFWDMFKEIKQTQPINKESQHF